MRHAKLSLQAAVPVVLSTLLLAIALLIMVMVSVSHAAEAKVQQADPLHPEPKLTILDCQTIFDGLSGLDGHTELSKDNTPVVLAYKFENSRLRLNIQQNMAVLSAARQEFNKGMQGVFREIVGDGFEIKPGTAEMARYNKQKNDAEQLPCKANLIPISATDLKLDKNEIPGSVLAALDKILDR